jgi:hypothetical protein
MKEKSDKIERKSEKEDEDGFDDFEDPPQFQAQNDIQMDRRSHESS